MGSVRLNPGDDVAAAVAGGGVVTLAPGTYEGGLWIEASVTVAGEPGAIIDAGRRGPALFIGAEGATVVVRGVTLTNGRSELGGGVRVAAADTVTIEDCVIEGNVAQQGGGNGAGVRAGDVRFVRTTFGPRDDLLFTGAAEVLLDACTVGGGVRAREGVQLRLKGGKIAGKVDVAGTTTRAPVVHVEGTAIAGGIVNDEELPGEIVEG